MEKQNLRIAKAFLEEKNKWEKETIIKLQELRQYSIRGRIDKLTNGRECVYEYVYVSLTNYRVDMKKINGGER